MYTPKNMALTDVDVQRDFVGKFGFAMLAGEDLQVTHVPLQWVTETDGLGVLIGHMARANPHWKSLQGQRCVAVFQGPHSYISPAWYAAGPAVPTWNYAAVHAYGRFVLVDETQTTDILDQLMAQYEPGWQNRLSDSDMAYQHKLRKAIVAFRIELDEVQGKEKLGQHRSAADQQGVVTGLSASQHPDAAPMLSYMQQRQLGLGLDD